MKGRAESDDNDKFLPNSLINSMGVSDVTRYVWVCIGSFEEGITGKSEKIIDWIIHIAVIQM